MGGGEGHALVGGRNVGCFIVKNNPLGLEPGKHDRTWPDSLGGGQVTLSAGMDQLYFGALIDGHAGEVGSAQATADNADFAGELLGCGLL